MYDFSELADIYATYDEFYAAEIKSKIKKSGHFVSIEKLDRNSSLLGWIKALNKYDLTLNVDDYEQLAIKELGNPKKIQCLSFNLTDQKTDAYRQFIFACVKYLDFSLPCYSGQDAKLMYEIRRGKIIDGFFADYNIRNGQYHHGNVVVCTHNSDDTCLMLFYNNNGQTWLGFYDISRKDELLAELKKSENETKNVGGTIIKMDNFSHPDSTPSA